jgi:hypothetical protein
MLFQARLRFLVSFEIVVRMQPVNSLITAPIIVWILIDLLLGGYLIVLIVELKQTRVALLDLLQVHFLLILLLRYRLARCDLLLHGNTAIVLLLWHLLLLLRSRGDKGFIAVFADTCWFLLLLHLPEEFDGVALDLIGLSGDIIHAFLKQGILGGEDSIVPVGAGVVVGWGLSCSCTGNGCCCENLAAGSSVTPLVFHPSH